MYESAQKLEMALGVATGFWNNLESRYRADLLQKSEEQRLSSMKEWLKDIPVRDLVDRGCIELTDDTGLLIKRALKFLASPVWMRGRMYG